MKRFIKAFTISEPKFYVIENDQKVSRVYVGQIIQPCLSRDKNKYKTCNELRVPDTDHSILGESIKLPTEYKVEKIEILNSTILFIRAESMNYFFDMKFVKNLEYYSLFRSIILHLGEFRDFILNKVRQFIRAFVLNVRLVRHLKTSIRFLKP